MGVPKFFRYISERYPCLSELAREEHIPDFDNLYLDMNGIIHNCSHPDDGNIHFKLSEEEMFTDIFSYIEKLFFLIKPQKLFFMAIDGVAPRAKMNQQRSRRFRSAKESESLAAQAQNRGEILPEDRFDSNCITPGTEFMERLHAALRHFIKYKISCDSLWQKCRVILSGHDCPGEGEHKIMDYIRYLKSQPNYNTYTRHCLYGLDADLIILGLCTHELHFAVLREEVKFGKKTKTKSVESTRFYLLHLGLLREYLELEFYELKQYDKNFDVANLIDDWILMGLLVGNDFVPHLPCMHIQTNAFPLLYKTYIKVYPELGGNINEHGKLNLKRLEKYFEALSVVEYEIFMENWTDLKYFEAKKTVNGIDEAFDIDIEDIKNGTLDEDLEHLIQRSQQTLSDGEDLELMTESEHIAEEIKKYKENYYMVKLDDMNKEQKREQALSYITALQWILNYYYKGVQSWDWYYPYHYAPFISDLKNIEDYEINFQMGKPFLPFAQLLAVLPAASKKLLPEAYHDLMTNPKSELLHFYPTDFKTDLNGKQHEWEAVVLIPFIDEKILLSAMARYESKLKPQEIKRNGHGPMYRYNYSSNSHGHLPGDFSFRTIENVFCDEKAIWPKEIAVDSERTVCVKLENMTRSVFYPGFPTFRHLEFNFELKPTRCRVFDYPSRNDNMVLIPKHRPLYEDVDAMAALYLNKTVYIGWPHLIKTFVVGVSDANKTITSEGKKDTDPNFKLKVQATQEHLNTRMAIELPSYDVLFHVNLYKGSSISICNKTGKLLEKDDWSTHVTSYPSQAIVADITEHNEEENKFQRVEELFSTNSIVFFTGSPYYGSKGVIIDPMLVYQCGRLKIQITVHSEPNLAEARMLQHNLDQEYLNTYDVSNILRISAKCLAKLSSSVLVMPGVRRVLEQGVNVKKTNIGLELRIARRNEQRADFVRQTNHQWFYTNRAISLLQDYIDRYPNVVEYLSGSPERTDTCFESDLFDDDATNQVNEIVAWLKDQPHFNAEFIPCGGQLVAKATVIKLLEAVDELKSSPVKTVKLQVKPHLLLKPDFSVPSNYESKYPIRLFDRVIIVKTTYMVPLGAKGTVIGIFPLRDPNPARLECAGVVAKFYEILFDNPLPSANDVYGIGQNQVYRVPQASILLIYTQENGNQFVQNDKVVDNSFIPSHARFKNNNNSNKNNNNSNWRNKDPIQKSIATDTNWRTQPRLNKEPTSEAKKKDEKPATGTEMETCTSKQVPRSKGGVEFWMPANAKPTPVNASSATNLQAFEKTDTNRKDNNSAQQSARVGIDFWMPSASGKLNSSNQQGNVANGSINQWRTSVLPNATTNEFEVKTMTLRNVLGIGVDDSASSSTPKPIVQQITPPPLPSLPQPPQYWKNDARKHREIEKAANWRQRNTFSSETISQPINAAQCLKIRDGFVPLQVMRNANTIRKESEIPKNMHTDNLNASINLQRTLQNTTIDDTSPDSTKKNQQHQQPQQAVDPWPSNETVRKTNQE